MSAQPSDLLEIFAACGAAGAAVSFFGLALTLPFMFRFGYTKGVRHIPLVFVALSLLVFLAMENLSSSGFDPATLAPLLENTGTIVGISLVVVLISLVAYGLSCLISLRLYKTREL